MQTVVADFLRKQAPKMAGQVKVALERRGFAKGDLSYEDQDTLDAVTQALDFSDWVVLAGDVKPVLEALTKDTGYAALAQVGLDVEARPDVMRVVNDFALNYASERGAEMVGMRVDELGRLVPNPNAKWQITEGTRDMVRAAVVDAIRNGTPVADLATQLIESRAFSDTRAEMIARTETNRANNEGAIAGYRASGLVQFKQWLTAEDDLVSEECQANGEAGDGDGIIPIDDDYPSGDDAPPVHPNAVLGGTLFAPYGELQEMVGADYHGPAVLIRTAQDKALAIGPNHPVLTARGMVKASNLREGDDLVYDARMDDALGAESDLDQMPLVEDAFQTLLTACSLSRVAAAAHDLHGDRIFCKGEIQVVKPARRLLRVLDPCGIEQMREFAFVGADMQAVAPAGDSSSRLDGDAVDLAPSSFMGRTLPSSHFEYLRIQSIHCVQWSGKAFDASTESGLYNSHGFVVSNCRCSIAPVVDFEAEATAPAETESED